MKATEVERSGKDQSGRCKDRSSVRAVADRCTGCKICRKECSFLRKYGRPKDIALKWEGTREMPDVLPFACSLCGLCSAVCPLKVDPQAMFLEMRRRTVEEGSGDFRCHEPILAYEKRGRSPFFSLTVLPVGCDTVLFPGCTLSGSRPEAVRSLFDLLRKRNPSLGIVLDCCSKPSHDLGRAEAFESAFNPLREALLQRGVRRVLVACASCYDMFNRHGDGLAVETVYEALAAGDLPVPVLTREALPVTVHDPCSVRFEPAIHEAVRALLRGSGLTVEEMPHARDKTLCCGEGGSVPFLDGDLAGRWGERRREEAAGRRVITYCAGCDHLLGRLMPTSHILDIVFKPEEALSGRIRPARAPWTYWNRWRLKLYFKRLLRAAAFRKRSAP